MKSLLALIALGLLGAGVTACGGSSSANNAGSASHVSSTTTTHIDTTSPAAPSSAVTYTRIRASRSDREKYDRDEDDYIHVPDDNNPSPLGYVTAAAADAQAVSKLVNRYYGAASKGDGASGCSMMEPSFVKAIPLDYGKLGPSYLRHAAGTCPAVMSLLFKHEHAQLARGVPQMHIVRVSVKGEQGIAILRFGRLRERFISVIREGSTWRIASVLDGELE